MSYLDLIKKYKDDDESLLKENPSLDNLYTFSKQGIGLIEILNFNKDDLVLYIGKINLPRLKYINDKAKGLYVYDINSSKDFINTYFEILNSSINITDKIIDISHLRFDKIIIISDLENSYKTDLKNYKSLLKDEGQFILALDNTYGIKYLQGASEENITLSYKQIINLFNELNFKNFSIYYPYPDYKVPLNIYSDEYYPQISDIEDIAAYNYPRYSMDSLKKNYSKSIKNNDFNLFSNSFLVIANSDIKKIFEKYSRNRIDAYTIKTSILKENNKFVIRKEALNEKALKHLKNMILSYTKLKDENPNIIYLKAREGIDYLDFDYIEGKSLNEVLFESIKNRTINFKLLSYYLDKIIGDGTINIDATFDNFIIKDNLIYGIDYEWVADEKLDKKYSYYRALNNFYTKYSKFLDISLIELFKKFDIKLYDIKKFKSLEESFQNKVHKDRQKIYLDNYHIDFKTAKQIDKIRKEKIDIENILKEKDLLISKQIERIRLTDTHVNNLESIISILREQEKYIDILNKNLSLSFKLKRKIKNLIDTKYPKNSKKRKKLHYLKLFLTKPFYIFSLISSKDGLNRIDGDFNIGSNYLERGKLIFKKVDEPLVSIIIPAYNQIEYTYACLESILDNVNDTSYEIILADDVSSDATKYISKYIDGIIHIRNSKNQGFLKNCNNAARYAKGKYLFFLNNDTTVNKTTVSALVSVLENDKTIGMVGSKLIYPDGKLQEAGGIIWSDASAWNYGRLDNKNKPEYNYLKDVDYISGAAIMLSNSLWKEIGGFDELYTPAYCEDSDLAFEVRKRGFRVVYQPKSEVVHFEGISNGTDVNGSGLKKYQIENTKKLREKWKLELNKHFPNTDFPNVFRARERNFDKKVILFIDHYVPTFDKDAGSKTTYQYLKMLISKGYVIKFLGDNFRKEEPYTTALENLGIEVLYGIDMQNNILNWIKCNEKNIHLVYLNRPHIAMNYIDFIKRNTELKIIYYGHDLHFLRELREYELTFNEKSLENSKYWKAIETSIMSKADVVYYPSNVEIEYINKIDENIYAKAITAYVYENFKDDIKKDFSKREGLLFVGGFSHPPNKDALIWFINTIWLKINNLYDIKFYVVGSNADEEIKNICNSTKGIIFKGFVSDEELEKLYLSTRMVIAPLRYGAGVKGKVIEALYYNMPILTTSVGAEGIENAKEIMLIADSSEEFAKKIVESYNNVEKLNSLSVNAEKYIKENNSIEAVWNIIKDDFI